MADELKYGVRMGEEGPLAPVRLIQSGEHVVSVPCHKGDWEWVEREWRAGVLSVRMLARMVGLNHMTIRREARRRGWPDRTVGERVKDRAQQIMERDVARAAQVADAEADRAEARYAAGGDAALREATSTYFPPDDPALSVREQAAEEAIVEANAAALASVLNRQRKDIDRARGLVSSLFEEVTEAGGGAKLAETLKKIITGDYTPETAGKLIERALGLGGRVQSAARLVDALRNLVAIERQAWNLDAGSTGESIGDVLAKMSEPEAE